MKKHVYHTKISISDLDTLGHVNNARYCQLYEEARWEMIFSNGITLDELRQRGQMPISIEYRVQFFKEIKLKQNLVIESAFVSLDGKTGVMHQEMKDEFGSIFSSADIKFAVMDLESRTLVEPTEFWMKIWTANH